MSKVSFCKLVIQQIFETKASVHFNIHFFNMDDKYYLPRTFFPRLFPLKKNDRISVGQVFIESASDAPCSFFAIFQSQVVKPISQKSIFESTWMESYFLALQLQAAQEVVSEKMPRRALVVNLLLFTEVASALLMVQLGQSCGSHCYTILSVKFDGHSKRALGTFYPSPRPARCSACCAITKELFDVWIAGQTRRYTNISGNHDFSSYSLPCASSSDAESWMRKPQMFVPQVCAVEGRPPVANRRNTAQGSASGVWMASSLGNQMVWWWWSLRGSRFAIWWGWVVPKKNCNIARGANHHVPEPDESITLATSKRRWIVLWRDEPRTSHGKTYLHCRDMGSRSVPILPERFLATEHWQWWIPLLHLCE